MTAPSELRLRPEGAALEIAWDDGEQSALDAATLRRSARSARALRAAIEGRTASTGDVRIVALNLVGHYGVNVVFSDGEEDAIFPWVYLRTLARAAAPAS